MIDNEKRVDAAATAMIEHALKMGKAEFVLPGRDTDIDLRELVRVGLAAADAVTAETHWIAPNEPTEEMSRRVTTILSHFEGEFGDYNVYFEEDKGEEIYRAMRDTYLTLPTSKAKRHDDQRRP